LTIVSVGYYGQQRPRDHCKASAEKKGTTADWKHNGFLATTGPEIQDHISPKQKMHAEANADNTSGPLFVTIPTYVQLIITICDALALVCIICH